MILRRFIQHLREQAWIAIFIDVLVVIFGVYFGIYLGTLSDDRQFRQETEAAIEALEWELRADLERIEQVIEFQRWKNTRTREAIELLGVEELDGERISELIRNTFGRNDTLFPHRAAYETLKTGEFLARHPDNHLRSQITNLFERHYARQTVNADLYDKLMFEATQSAVNPNWDIVGQRLTYDDTARKGIIRNGLLMIADQGEFYTDLLRDVLEPELRKTLKMIDASQPSAQGNGIN